MADVTLKNLVKEYRDDKRSTFRAVKGINLDIRNREFMVLVGPSGCGKSTSLRMIAGLENVTDGAITIDEQVINEVQPKDRNIAMVFQNYALYPHMTIFENMAFGLKLLKYPKNEIKKRVNDAADILGLTSMLNRKPKQLSGGQRQRVAVGRAIVRKPKVFLFDEPLSNLDAKMRVQMRTEISKLHARLNATMIYVTHDQVEAMTMGDRICVMKDGNIMQVAEPLELYNNPKNMFTAGFIGSPPMNFFHGKVNTVNGKLAFIENNNKKAPFSILFDDRLSRLARAHQNQNIVLGIRPEDIADALTLTREDNSCCMSAEVEVSEPMGSETYLYLNTGSHNFIARVHSEHRFKFGQNLKVAFNLSKAHLFDPTTEDVIS
ncbi:sn-glycerol-3-phosphate ABC transporter ATP-binding protein UgpC [Rubellicoccus peritrichatus]|uniref:Sn-glycerol-3-phosphate ABC transporter ATP-binding protein UgpC n=1 Tax=Rubellicoccus peritrichatus TaxID=3080537 RepID=A0AAQ3QUR7_9BACT|nr:sn-glycerol-3-phosphate ABC transporter ATP-binding protein UgpC [Puniceicoccus sp. CR14]WOO40067.1 sn-glycerol-3-phosphate ABC transporter ATP-binding protein UgpC [Puniceicoccus sp. CR14]